MSVRTMARVWDASTHSGTELLMLLAIADFADDEGNAYPAVGTLASKCRMSPRNANFILTALRTSGELEVRANEGPKGTNRYKVVTGMKAASPLKSASPLKPASPTPEAGFLKPLKPTSDEPSMNHQEPPDRSLRCAKLQLCPHQSIVDLYHEALPELPRAKLMGDARKKALKAFWVWILTSGKSNGKPRATTSEQALVWIKSYFERARTNDFLMGRTARGDGHAGWKCDLDFLLTEKGKRQVIEKSGNLA
jgi:hypothetical protein